MKVSENTKEQLKEESLWGAWISRKTAHGQGSYDVVCELVVSSYSLSRRTREAYMKDQVQFFLEWWFKNKKYMERYISYSEVARLLKINHATVLHHLRVRKKSLRYEENTKCIKDFLES